MSPRNEPTPDTIMKNAYSVFPAFAMYAGMKMDLFSPLTNGPLTGNALSDKLSVSQDRLSPLLYALVTAGLLRVENGMFSNTREADAFLVKGRNGYLGGMSGFFRNMWDAALCTAETIQQDIPQKKHDWSDMDIDYLVSFYESQYPGNYSTGVQLAEQFDLSRHHTFLDAGGGSGGVAVGLCDSMPHLKGTIIELSNVAPVTRRFLSGTEKGKTIDVVEADLLAGPPEATYDFVVLRALIQTLSREDARTMLSNVARAVKPGGSIFILGRILNNDRLSPKESVAFSLIFLNTYEEGGTFTEEEHRQWLESSGFENIRLTHNAFSDGIGMIHAVKKPPTSVKDRDSDGT